MSQETQPRRLVVKIERATRRVYTEIGASTTAANASRLLEALHARRPVRFRCVHMDKG
jgi:hypothetical protein